MNEKKCQQNSEAFKVLFCFNIIQHTTSRAFIATVSFIIIGHLILAISTSRDFVTSKVEKQLKGCYSESNKQNILENLLKSRSQQLPIILHSDYYIYL